MFYDINSKSSINKLSLSNNSISEIDDKQFIKLISLQTIILSHNLIAEIGNETFEFNTILSRIDLSFNVIIHFEFNLRALPYLYDLNLSNNLLTTLDEHAFSSYIGRKTSCNTYLDVSSNTFTCDCTMHWLLMVEHGRHVRIEAGSDTCQGDVVSDITVNISCYIELVAYQSDTCPSFNISRCDEVILPDG